VNISTLQIYRRRPIEYSKGYTVLAADGVVAMALALKCQVWWFKWFKYGGLAYIVYREKRRVRGWIGAAKVRSRRYIVIENFSRKKHGVDAKQIYIC
jgi:hypothetical protein